MSIFRLALRKADSEKTLQDNQYKRSVNITFRVIAKGLKVKEY